MQFQLEHDWQSNMSEPKANLGEKTKTNLLLLLCAIWIFSGLASHAPWKPLETDSISIVQTILETGNVIAPTAYYETDISAPPLYYLTAALGAKLFSPLLEMHDGARLMNAIWLTITLLMVGMTGRETWGRGIGRHATFIMIGTIGLMFTAHSLNHHVGAFAAIATGFYAMILLPRRPRRAAVLYGLALGFGFLISGFLPLAIILIPTLLSLLFSRQWRTKRTLIFLATAFAVALPPMIAWLVSFNHYYPALFQRWLIFEQSCFSFNSHFYFLRTLVWYAWPALPLALVGIWHYRDKLIFNPKFQYLLIFFLTTFTLLGFCANAKDIYTLPLLLPLVALGAGSVERLKRDFAAALNWFGVTAFTFFGFLIWLGWVGIMTGTPPKIQERMQFLSGADYLIFNPITFSIAVLMTIVWLMVSIRSKLSKRATVTNWAIGMTFLWSLLMCLWLPMIDFAKSYEKPFKKLSKVVPDHYNCMHGLNVGSSQSKLLYYYTNIELIKVKQTEQLHCDLYLIQDQKGVGKMIPGPEWKQIWQGKRPANRKERFRLLQKIDSVNT